MAVGFRVEDPEAVPVRDASTVMLLRDGSEGLEVVMLRRNLSSDFVGGAYVFPGGGVDVGDGGADVAGLCVGRDDAAASGAVGVDSGGLAFWVAAVRETFEEAGLLLAVDDAGSFVDLRAPDAASRFGEHRRAVDSGRRSLAAVLEEEGLRLAVDRVHYFSRWVTPLGAPRRYDTRFFVAVAPPAQDALADQREVVEHLWVRPADALARSREGDFEMIFPTVRSLEALERFGSAEEVVAHAATIGRIDAVLPTMVEADGGYRILLPGDVAYDAISGFPVDSL